MGEWNPLTFKNICRNQRGGKGISGGPVLSALSCVPKFAAMASALIENIWATAAAAYRWGGGQGTKGACERTLKWGKWSRRRRPYLMPIPCFAGGRD